MDKFIVKRSRLEVPQQETVPSVPPLLPPPPPVKLLHLTEAPVAAAGTSGTAYTVPESDGRVARASTGKRSFSNQWLKTYPWLIYHEENDKAFCQTCQNANQKCLLDSSK